MGRNLKKAFLSSATLLFFLLLLFQGRAQSTMDLRLNEILVYNDSSYTDDFGMHVPWIEIFNTAYNSVNIGGLYLSDDLNNPKKYLIPKGDPRTKIPSRYYVVFFADNNTDRGVFHLNFRLKESETIVLFDSNGETLIDSLKIPPGQLKDVTYGRVKDGIQAWDFLEKATPNANNNINPGKNSGEVFRDFDPSGIGLTMIAMSVVFLALFLLYLIYKWIGKSFSVRTFKKGKLKPLTKKGLTVKDTGPVSGEVNVAIIMAIYLYQNELHDIENPVLTIQKVSRTYSPWSSKIYSIRKKPNR